MKLKLKVFTNSSNGQMAVHLPKKIFTKMPENVEIKVPKSYIKDIFKHAQRKSSG